MSVEERVKEANDYYLYGKYLLMKGDLLNFNVVLDGMNSRFKQYYRFDCEFDRGYEAWIVNKAMLEVMFDTYNSKLWGWNSGSSEII